MMTLDYKMVLEIIFRSHNMSKSTSIFKQALLVEEKEELTLTQKSSSLSKISFILIVTIHLVVVIARPNLTDKDSAQTLQIYPSNTNAKPQSSCLLRSTPRIPTASSSITKTTSP